MKFRYLVFISILSFCLACQGKKKATLSDLPRPVRVIKVEALGTFNHQYTGTVTARNFSILAFRLPGTLTEVNVNTGQKIKKGTVIARIDPYDYQRQYQTALANYKTTESIYESAPLCCQCRSQTKPGNSPNRLYSGHFSPEYGPAYSGLHRTDRTIRRVYRTTLRRESRRNTYRAIDRQKEFTGILKGFDENTVTIIYEDETEQVFDRAEIALIRLAFDF